MADRIFIDTWGWLTLRDKSEKNHREIAELFIEWISDGHLLYTTDYVLDETITLLFKRLSPFKAQESLELIFKAREEDEFQLEFVSPERFFQTCAMRKKFGDKPDISFTDLSSMVVMKELDITQILTQDGHFGHVNLGFQLVPKQKNP